MFFGRDQDSYSTLLTIGFLASLVSYLVILFKDSVKSKLIWTGIVIASIGVQQLTEPLLIRQSYKYLIARHENLFFKVNSIFISKPGEVSFPGSPCDSSRFSREEQSVINKLFKETGIYIIIKDTSKVYYGTWGMLDVRLGISYFYSNKLPDKPYQLIKEHWYH